MEESKIQTRQFLTFQLENETYAFHVLKIKEVLEVPEITKIPKSLPYMAGVINLRGGIIPLVDLRIKFELPDKEITENSAIIIVEIDYDNEVIQLGALVDSVKKVIKLNMEELEEPPKVGMTIDNRFIDALGKFNKKLIIILDSDSLFSHEELIKVSNFSETKTTKVKNVSSKSISQEVRK
ncbi:MAG: purine-binding chemotaxis protein CheW [Spirochaetales bacterium]|nr:purine-binding chemotaxis protein CheW [Spirochaetales bacterium]